MTGEPMHTISKERVALNLIILFECTSHHQLLKSEVAIMLHFQLQYVWLLIHFYEQRIVVEVPLKSIQSLWKIWVTNVGKLSNANANCEKWNTKEDKGVYINP